MCGECNWVEKPKKVFFTADTHFFHRNIIDYCSRGFGSAEEMNEDIIRRWNEVVATGDLVYHIGDFGMANANRLGTIRARLNGRIILVLGNHDYNFSKKKWLEVVGVDEVVDKVDYEEFTLNHLPVLDSVDPLSLDRWLLCGHIHNLWRVKGRQLNVGVDVQGFYPITIEQVRAQVRAAEEERQKVVTATRNQKIGSRYNLDNGIAVEDPNGTHVLVSLSDGQENLRWMKHEDTPA